MPGSLHSSTIATIAPTEADAEAVLIARAQCDPDAFGPLYEIYFDAVYRYCYHRLGDWADAEDAASLVFTNALAALPRYRGDHDALSFRAWLFTIAHNVVANHHRHRSRHPDRPLETAARLRDASPSPEDDALRHEAHLTVHNLLAQLPEEQRRLLELRLTGLTDAEIARVVGRNHGAVRASQFRAVARLRSLLGIEARSKGRNDV
jgi:RNA polymerase sigma-70 factor (ECF subfamily)